MRVIDKGPTWAMVEANLDEMRERMLAPGEGIDLLGGENCLFTLAKAYHQHGCKWYISGYARDGGDVARALAGRQS